MQDSEYPCIASHSSLSIIIYIFYSENYVDEHLWMYYNLGFEIINVWK